MSIKLNYIAIFLALIFAMPSSGISLLLYFMGWIFYSWWRRKFAMEHLRSLGNVEEAVLYIGTKHNGESIGTSFDEITMSDLMRWLKSQGIAFRQYAHAEQTNRKKPVEFSLSVAGTKYDVDAHVNHEHADEAFIRVKTSESQTDELYEWMCKARMPLAISKWELQALKDLNLGCFGWRTGDKDCQKPISCAVHPFRNVNIFALASERENALPQAIGILKNLERVRIECSDVEVIPDSICKLFKLRVLSFRRNKVKRLPDLIGSLKGLEIIDISHNKIHALPESIVELRSLNKLYLFGNECLVLSDQQIKWLTILINEGANVVIDAVSAESLLATKISSSVIQIRCSIVAFNHERL